jgi:AsmA protein
VTLRKLVFWSVTAVLLAGILAPFVNAARFKSQIRAALERSLGRKVEILGDVHFTLFSGPGFTLGNVLIADDSRFGLEPMAHVMELSAVVEASSLWTGRLGFSRLRLDEPSLNVVRDAAGRWNIQPLVQRAMAAPAPARGAPFPDISVRGGRINFKIADTKSVFFGEPGTSPPAPPTLRWHGSGAR